jgi:hypothetical protein
MVEGQMKGMHIFCIKLPEILSIYYITLKPPTYLEVASGNTKYHHQDGVIPNVVITLVLSDHG